MNEGIWCRCRCRCTNRTKLSLIYIYIASICVYGRLYIHIYIYIEHKQKQKKQKKTSIQVKEMLYRKTCCAGKSKRMWTKYLCHATHTLFIEGQGIVCVCMCL